MSWRGLSNRVTSPTSVANVTATIRSTPRKVCSARTIGANDQARSAAEYAGTDRRAKYGGAVPNARHCDWVQLYDPADGTGNGIVYSSRFIDDAEAEKS